MSTITEFRILVNAKLQDDKKVLGDFSADNTIYDAYIEEAVREYSRRRPSKGIYSHTVTASETTVFELPSDWEQGFSRIINIEYPVAEYPPEILDNKDYEIEQTTDGWRLRFLDSPYPVLDEEFWVRYTKRQTVSVSTSTIPASDEEAISNLAVALACESLANFYVTTTDSTMTADVIAYQTKGAEYRSQAAQFRKLFDNMVYQETTGVIGEWDQELFDEREALTHLKARV